MWLRIRTLWPQPVWGLLLLAVLFVLLMLFTGWLADFLQIGLITLVILGLVLWIGFGWILFRVLVVVGVLALAWLVLAVALNGYRDDGNGNKGEQGQEAYPPKPNEPTVTTPAPSTPAPSPVVSDEWSLHRYQFDPRVPAGYFGPSCKPLKRHGKFVVTRTKRCKRELLSRLKHDPMLLSVMVDEFNLLPAGESRKEFAERAEDVDVRKHYQPMVKTVLRTIRHLRFVPLSGRYYTQYVDRHGNVYQVRKYMNPARHIALCGTPADGRRRCVKSDCGFQPVSRHPQPHVRIRQHHKPISRHRIPRRHKCSGNKICGTPARGPEQQSVQANQPSLVRPTPGYTPGNAERVTEVQSGDSTGRTNTPAGTNSGSPSGTPPSNNDVPGGSETGAVGGTQTGTKGEGSGQSSDGIPPPP